MATGPKLEGTAAAAGRLPPPLKAVEPAGAAATPPPLPPVMPPPLAQSALADGAAGIPVTPAAPPPPPRPTKATSTPTAPPSLPTPSATPPRLALATPAPSAPDRGSKPIPATGPAERAEGAAREPKAEPEAATDDAPEARPRRRAAGAARARVAANDDAPSIGGLIYALQQEPSRRPMTIAAIASGVWAVLGMLLGWAIIASELQRSPTFFEALSRPSALAVVATIVIPIALFWFLAILVWRAQELRLMSSAMTEVAIRLAEPDRMAEQQVASVGQAVRRQVSFMNDAVSRALGRAGELEALVHSEVQALERAYRDNEHRIRGLIQELSGERNALVSTTDQVSRAIKEIGTEIPTLVERLGEQQRRLAGFIEGAGQNLIALESSLARSTDDMERVLGSQTERIEAVFTDFTQTLGTALEQRADLMRQNFQLYSGQLDQAIAGRTEDLQAVFETYAQVLDQTLERRQLALDTQLVERTRMLDEAFSERVRLFDNSITRATLAVDSAVANKALELTRVLEGHAEQIGSVLTSQADTLDHRLLDGVTAVRKASESVTRQSIAAIEGLAAETHKLQSISESLLGRIAAEARRFESQGQVIVHAAGALEAANERIDQTLQIRQRELAGTLAQLVDKTGEIDRVMGGYTERLEASVSAAELRAREVGEQLTRGAETQARTALTELNRLAASADTEADRAIEALRAKFSTASSEVGVQLGSLTSRLNETSEEVRQRTRAALSELDVEQARLRSELQRLPETTQASVEAMRGSLQEQLRALQELSSLTTRETQRRDIRPPQARLAAPRPAATTPPAEPAAGYQHAPGILPPSVQPAAPLMPSIAMSAAAQATAPAATDATQAARGSGGREGWKDLLARASSEEESGRPIGADAAGINVTGIVRALDATTAAAIWSRFRAGQRGIMVPSIYSREGRSIFDEVHRRYRSEAEFHGTVDRYLLDFENVLRDADQQDASGRLAQSYIITDGGRVYLFLAHASGRLS